MRAVLLLGLALLAPSAIAGAMDVDVVIDPIPKVEPMRAATLVNVTVHVPCLNAAGRDAKIELSAQGPTWANILVSPVFLTLKDQACGADGKVIGHAVVSVSASDQAPADTPAPLIVTAMATGVAGQVKGSNQTSVTAGWIGILDVQLSESVFVMRPGSTLIVPLKLVNLGNGNMRVSASWQNQTMLSADVPGTLLESKQQGSTTNTVEIPVTLRTPPASGFVNHVDVITINLTGVYDKDPTLKGEHATVSLVVTTKGGSIGGQAVPATPPWVLLVGIALVAALRRLRG